MYVGKGWKARESKIKMQTAEENVRKERMRVDRQQSLWTCIDKLSQAALVREGEKARVFWQLGAITAAEGSLCVCVWLCICVCFSLCGCRWLRICARTVLVCRCMCMRTCTRKTKGRDRQWRFFWFRDKEGEKESVAQRLDEGQIHFF